MSRETITYQAMRKSTTRGPHGALRALLFFILATAASLAPQGNAEAAEKRTLNVTATIFPFADITRRVGGEFVIVHTLLKPGQGPHTYEPTPGDMRKIESSDVVVMAGFELEHWLEKLLEISKKEGRVEVDCSKLVRDPIRMEGSRHDGHSHGDINPHYWLDPTLMKKAAKLIGKTLASALPSAQEVIERRTDDLTAELTKLDREIAKRLDGPEVGKEYVAFHNAWDYYAARYGLKQVGVIETAPGRKPSAKHFAGLVKKIQDTKARAVMVEPQLSPQLGEALAKEAGVKVGMVDPIGGVDGRDSYINLMRWNTEQFVKALSGE